ncbi:unnamed protein product, partial (mitochondrion) [Sympodiomycopsis kandeliae]
WVNIDTIYSTIELFSIEYENSIIIVCFALPIIIKNKVTRKQLGTITGCILGDGHIQKRDKNRVNSKINGRYIISIKASSKNYIVFLCEKVFIFSGKIILNPYPNIKLPQHENKKVTQYFFYRRSIPFFTDLHNIWYKWNASENKYIKIVPKNVSDIFTCETIAHWIIQDGYFDNYGRRKTTILCTESFSKNECYILQQALSSFNIKTRLKVRNKEKGRYRIRIRKKSISKVIELVKDIIPIEYHYKIGIKYLGLL